jgi:hypothetical protein
MLFIAVLMLVKACWYFSMSDLWTRRQSLWVWR